MRTFDNASTNEHRWEHGCMLLLKVVSGECVTEVVICLDWIVVMDCDDGLVCVCVYRSRV